MGEEQRPERGVVRDEKMGVMIVGEILGREGPATPKHVFPSSLPKSLPKGFYPGTVTCLIQSLLQHVFKHQLRRFKFNFPYEYESTTARISHIKLSVLSCSPFSVKYSRVVRW